MHHVHAPRNPAARVIELLGGTTKVAAICGVKRCQPWRWMQTKENGGTRHGIPRKYWPMIRKHAEDNGIEIPVQLFVPELAE